MFRLNITIIGWRDEKMDGEEKKNKTNLHICTFEIREWMKRISVFLYFCSLCLSLLFCECRNWYFEKIKD